MEGAWDLGVEKRRRTARPKTTAQLAGQYPISVVIPVRNPGSAFSECLRALASNDLEGVEILVVDDASDQEVAAPPESLPDAELRVIRLQRRLGPAGARNRGLREAVHPHVLFLDSDVVLPPRSVEWIREGLDLYSHRPEVAGILGVYAEEVPWSDFFSVYKNLYTCFLYRTTETVTPFVHTAIFCVRKAVLESVGGFDGRLATAEDFRLGVDLGVRGHRFVIDRRIAGVHLKRYRLGAILKEDRRRIRDLRRVQLSRDEQLFYYRAHRWTRILSVALPPAVLVLGAAALWAPGFGASAALLLILFYGLNLPFLNYCRRRRGAVFAIRSALFLFLEMLWAAFCAASALLGERRMAPVAKKDAPEPGNPG